MQFMMKMLMDVDKAFEPNAELMSAIGRFTDEIHKAGKLVQTGGMSSSAKVSRIRASGGKLTVTDGPFAETKEQLAGYYLIEARDADEAAAVASKIPGASRGSVEVRAIRIVS